MTLLHRWFLIIPFHVILMIKVNELVQLRNGYDTLPWKYTLMRFEVLTP